MDAKTIERLRHAAEVLTWAADGKPFQYINDSGASTEPVPEPEVWVERIMYGSGVCYRLKSAKKRRTFNEQEARRLLGCVRTLGLGGREIITDISRDALHKYMLMASHYHLPGHPDNLLPCWVEE